MFVSEYVNDLKNPDFTTTKRMTKLKKVTIEQSSST